MEAKRVISILILLSNLVLIPLASAQHIDEWK